MTAFIMGSKPRIAVVIGSTRHGRLADKPAEWILKQAQARGDINVELVDLRDHPMPFFDEAGSNRRVPTQNPEAMRWQETIARFDGFIFVVAEYNHSVTGVLKNALDQAYKEWVRKPFSAIGYGGVGAARAIEHLRLIGVELQMVSTSETVHIGGADFITISATGGNKPIEDIEAHPATRDETSTGRIGLVGPCHHHGKGGGTSAVVSVRTANRPAGTAAVHG